MKPTRVLAALLACLLIPPAQAHGADRADLAAFLDHLVREQMAKTRTPGAVVAVVRDGEVLLLKGYGFADAASRRPVVAERTIFAVGSVSKPVTATAVLALAESGRLRLDADVNSVLHAFQVPATFRRPVTAADLLTHTAGFDTSLIGTAAPRPEEVGPLGRYLAARLPPRVRPPGQVLSYSNHGYTLLGHLVEEVTSVPFPRAMEDLVFQPLGMGRSSFAALPQGTADLATGYEPWGEGGLRIAPPVYPRIVPAASLTTTGADMARFMIAHLEGGGRALRPETVAAMHRQHFTQHPGMPGMAWGLFESRANGQRCLFHGGGVRGFMSGLYLWPEHRLGLFVADNGYDADLIEGVAHGLLDHEFPFQPPEPRPSAGGREHARRCAGAYRLTAQPRANLEKAAALRQRSFVISDLGDGALGIWGERFLEVEPWLYQAARGQERVAFRPGPDGRAALFVTEELFTGNQVWERVPWYASGSLHVTLLLLFIALFLSALFVRPPEGGRSLFEERAEPPAAARRAVSLGILLSAVDLAFLLLAFIGFRQAARGAGLLYGLPLLMKIALVLPLLGVPLALAFPVYAARAWRERFWSPGWRVYFTALASAGLGFLAFLAVWNLLGIRA